MEADVVDRLREFMTQFSLTQADVEARAGIKQQNLSSILNRKRPCGDGVINKLVISFDLNRDWLINGKGTMLRSGIMQTAGNVSGDNNTVNAVGESDKVNLLQERVKHLEELLAEKERLINVLLETRGK